MPLFCYLESHKKTDKNYDHSQLGKVALERKINTEDLKEGMYVSRLDRSWLETPFLFQGFFIKQDDIPVLQKYCSHVFVNLDKKNSDIQIPEITAKPKNNKVLPPRHTEYDDSVPVEKEIQFAKECHASLSEYMQGIGKTIKEGKPIRLIEISDSVNQMIKSIIRNPDAFMWLTKLKNLDDYSYKHSIDASILAVSFGRHLGLSQMDLQNLAIGGLFFDIGKAKLDESILSKPGRLTTEEFESIKNHVAHSIEILQQTNKVDESILDMIRYHHERHDGSGYPHGLKGLQIPLFARIAAIVDCYDAITTPRIYNQAVSSLEAIKQLYEWRDVDFQKELIEEFIQCIGVFPTGSIVELNSGEIGVVLSQNRIRRLRPKLMLILDSNQVSLDHYPILDLGQEQAGGNKIEIVTTHEPGSFGIDPREFFL